MTVAAIMLAVNTKTSILFSLAPTLWRAKCVLLNIRCGPRAQILVNTRPGFYSS